MTAARWHDTPEWRVDATDADYEDGVRCVVMPCCGFTFDATHVDDLPPEVTARYTCPACSAREEADEAVAAYRQKLRTQIEAMSSDAIAVDRSAAYCLGAVLALLRGYTMNEEDLER